MDRNILLRERLDTGCTVDSKDSGIDVVSKSRPLNRMRVMKRPTKSSNPEQKQRSFSMEKKKIKKVKINVDIDTFLWICCFGLTCWMFKLPASVWFSYRTHWPSMYISMLFGGLFFVTGAFMYWKRKTVLHWRSHHPFLYPISWAFLLGSALAFCYATWTLFNLWSAYISFVTVMFLISVVPLLAYLSS